MNLHTQYMLLDAQGKTQTMSLAEIFSHNEKTLLYVYPRDNTPGCTIENKDFSCLKYDFEKI